MWFIYFLAANPILSFVLSIFFAVFGTVLLALAAAFKGPRALLLWPLVMTPVTLSAYEWMTGRALFREALMRRGTAGTLTVYDSAESGIIVNGRRVVDDLALIRSDAEPAAIKIRFHDFEPLSCASGAPLPLLPGKIYSVMLKTDAPEEFCVAQTAREGAQTERCAALAEAVREQEARLRLSPADAAAEADRRTAAESFASLCGNDQAP